MQEGVVELVKSYFEELSVGPLPVPADPSKFSIDAAFVPEDPDQPDATARSSRL